MILHSFRPVLPLHHLPQGETVDWIFKSHIRSASVSGISLPNQFSERFMRFALHEEQIKNRYFECNEIDEVWDAHQIYSILKERPAGASIETRNLFFKEKSLRVFDELYSQHSPSQLIHVTCSGYVSPSPAQEYFSGRQKYPEITHAYHMGCYASLPAVRMAEGLVLLHKKDVDIVHTEICSLHLDPSIHTPEQIVVQSLFADGHIKYTVSEEAQKGFEILAIQEHIVPNSLGDMTWIPGATGMKMTLSREVPIKIRDELPKFVQDLCDKANVSLAQVKQSGIFAIHPGGPKIIEGVQKKLELNDEQIAISKKVLFDRGNMSSATLPHIWDEILNTPQMNNVLVLSLAFGPGLTIFGSLFRIRQ